MRQLLTVALALVATATHAQTTPAAPSGSVLSAPGGRFAYGQIGEYRADQYLLDTVSGRLWKLTCIANTEDGKQCARQGLHALPFVDDDGKILTWAPEVPTKK